MEARGCIERLAGAWKEEDKGWETEVGTASRFPFWDSVGGVNGADGGRLGAGEAVDREGPDAATAVVAGLSDDGAWSCSNLGFLRDAG